MYVLLQISLFYNYCHSCAVSNFQSQSKLRAVSSLNFLSILTCSNCSGFDICSCIKPCSVHVHHIISLIIFSEFNRINIRLISSTMIHVDSFFLPLPLTIKTLFPSKAFEVDEQRQCCSFENKLFCYHLSKLQM